MSARAFPGLLCVLILVVACNGPLPADEPAADFLFRYTYERIEEPDRKPVPEPAATADAATEDAAAEDAAAEDAAAEPADAPAGGDGEDPVEGDGEAPSETEAEPPAESAPATPASPIRLRISLEVGGHVKYEAYYSTASAEMKRSEFQIDEKAQARIYRALREADIYGMDPVYEGPEKWRGRETFEVVSRNRQKEVIVEGVVVDRLVDLRNLLLDSLPSEETIEPPLPGRKVVIMDVRSRIFFRSTNPKVSEIPPEFRKEFPNPWAALNAGGRPDADFGPMPDRWD